MAKITFVLGGARSGKSSFALKTALRCRGKTAFIATCQPLDPEMKKRIARHQRSRPKHWQTFEEPRDIGSLLKKIGAGFDTIVIDCLTLLISNLMMDNQDEKTIEKKFKDVLNTLDKIKAQTIIVSNEVGLGIVPANKLGREFRDIAGRINQMLAAKADNVFFLISGIPWKIK
ncbi:MAG: bifunctional adenosylcobinamide kinase/adenosylcobinamide-phosphate guanylyltransferase [Candidatus Omnitrophica bacterium]|nr:bifunctional adenosylcobinamide kinase/adenosylcobinamide-phosphate guanylyltransferase [Candidatus Omnitrophota bacterium]